MSPGAEQVLRAPGLALREYAIHEQVRAMAVLIDDLFELAQLDARAVSADGEAALHPVIESCLRGLQAEALARRVRLERRASWTRCPTCGVRGDRGVRG